ncbi:MAG: AI-2E family transporter [Acidimicrobiales bacterium]
MADANQPDSPPPRTRERLRFSPRSVITAVAIFGITVSLLGLAAASERVIGWILVAGTTAGLLHPIVNHLQRPLRKRGLAVLAVMVLLLASTGAVVYGLVDNVVRETRRLQEAAPERARRLEESERFGQLARDLRLEERTRRFLEDVPERLRGGSPAEALRAAGTRGVAFLATTVLTVFFLLHGPKLVRSAFRQIGDPERRERVATVVTAVYRRAFGYASANLAMAVAAGLFAYVLARWADVPGPAPLGIWVGLWDLVPLAGATVGALPIIVMAAVVSGGKAAVLAVAFIVYQVVEDVFVARPVERDTLRLGPFLTVAAGLVGLELSGIAGALLAVLAAAMAVAAADELALQQPDAEVAPANADREGADLPDAQPEPEPVGDQEPAGESK